MSNPVLDMLTDAQRAALVERGVDDIHLHRVRVFHDPLVGIVGECRFDTGEATFDGSNIVRVVSATSTGKLWDDYTYAERDD